MAPSVVPFIRVMAHSTKLFVITVLYVVVAPIFPLFIYFFFAPARRAAAGYLIPILLFLFFCFLIRTNKDLPGGHRR